MALIRNHYGFIVDLEFGALERTVEYMTMLSIDRPLICTDKGIVATGLLDKLKAQLSGDVEYAVYDETPPNPTERAVMNAAEMYRVQRCNGVIALGGGSPIDLAKGVAVMATHDGTISDWFVTTSKGEEIGPCAPLIAIPTTAGTGSECSQGAVIISNSGIKSGVRSFHFTPRVAICDPELTIGLPAGLTAATGMDTITHCIEAFLSPMDNPIASLIALDGLKRATTYLKRAVADGTDREARYEMMLAATQGGMGFAKGLGIVHTMSHAIGANQQLQLHHGTLNAVLLPAMLRFNAAHTGSKYDELREALGLEPSTDLALWMTEFNASIGMPASLSEMGVTKEMIPHLVEHALQDPLHLVSPKPPTSDEYTALFMEALDA